MLSYVYSIFLDNIFGIYEEYSVRYSVQHIVHFSIKCIIVFSTALSEQKLCCTKISEIIPTFSYNVKKILVLPNLQISFCVTKNGQNKIFEPVPIVSDILGHLVSLYPARLHITFLFMRYLSNKMYLLHKFKQKKVILTVHFSIQCSIVFSTALSEQKLCCT